MMKNCDSDETNKTDNNSSCDIKTHKAAKVVRKENTNAKNRWKLLARAILSNNKREMKIKEKLLPMSDVSQVFSGFDLVSVERVRREGDAETFTIRFDAASGCDYECSVHIEKLWTMKDLIGFNNTGNVAFWTSEAALTYFALDNLPLFNDSWVLELGGGMFCLSGLMLAKYSNAFAVHLSDGNESSMNNVRNSIALNTARCFVKTSGKRQPTTFPRGS
jgi:calmodulin-lysine N-methyltransferase